MYWNLLKAMKEANLNINAVAKIINKSTNTVRNKLNRKYDFTYDEMLKLKTALKTKQPLEKLFYWEQKKKTLLSDQEPQSLHKPKYD